MTKGRYVDIFGGAESISEAKAIINQLIQLCGAGRFPLQKWSSNYPEILPHNTEKTSPIVEPEPTLHKILGFNWKTDTDNFYFSVKPPTDTIYIKRMIASDIAKLYDPLGLNTPVIVRAKIILQEL